MAKSPYADKPIHLSIRSISGLKYRVLNCWECGRGFLERNNDQLFRINTQALPYEAHVGADGAVEGLCGNCGQKYTVTISTQVSYASGAIPLYMQAQSIFLAVEPAKQSRDIFCYECGKAFFGISDRIAMVVDEVAPSALIDPAKLGSMEARCKFQHCKQRFHVRV